MPRGASRSLPQLRPAPRPAHNQCPHDLLELAARIGRRRQQAPPRSPRADRNDLAPIELYTADARIVGWISANGQRVTDLLNGKDELRLWHPSPGPITTPVDHNSGEPITVRRRPRRVAVAS